MEITLDRLKSIIGDKECQIVILNSEKAKLIEAYNKLVEANEELTEELDKKKSKKTEKAD